MMFSKNIFILCSILVTFAYATVGSDDTDIGLDILQYLKKYKYDAEEHTVTTEDGYILTLFRITSGQDGTHKGDKKPPVLLMHGLESSSMDWVNFGPGKSISLILADLGYDVWLGNARGSTWSKSHQTLNITEKEFWHFSFHEIGNYDLPAKIDYILKTTGFEKISYIGHSQGTTSFFIMNALKPEYNDKILIMAALAPVAYMSNLEHPFIQVFANPLVNLGFGAVLNALKMYLVLPHSDLITELGRTICYKGSEFESFCASVFYLIGGKNEEQYVPEMLPVIMSSAPAGASYKQLMHYLQEVRSGYFRAFDYGLLGNKEKYNQKTPPVYNTKKITAPVALYYSTNDLFASDTDVKKLESELPNVVQSYLVPSNFTHFDFLWAKDVATLLNNDVVDLMNKYNNVKPQGGDATNLLGSLSMTLATVISSMSLK